MIPGPIELEPDVLAALAQPQLGHMDARVADAFRRVLLRLREVFQAPGAQPFVVAGSGTLAMELAVANLVDPGERAVVVSTGYFGDRMASILERLGASVVPVRARPGEAPPMDDVAAALAAAPTKVLTVTHVDTSTGVRAPVEALARLGRAHGALIVVDGVCSVGGEALAQEAWGVDVCLTGSQKALGAPPGLAIVSAGERALAARRDKKRPVPSLYLDFLEWLPIMQAYERAAPKYFATPAVNLVLALDASLARIVVEEMEPRVRRHTRMAGAFRAAFAALGLRLLAASEELAANTLSAVWLPEGVDAGLVARVRAEGVALAGGLHPEVRERTFRIGHMGSVRASEVLVTVGALERGLGAVGHRVTPGAGLAAAQAALS
jgi:alanine-glyoxylate transaminase/serine-glyoxylate transaminase/serine-pyruvate transaminase